MMTGPMNLQCPACGHVFMSIQHRSDSVEACPHCSYSGQRPHFVQSTQPLSGQPLQVVRRIPRRPAADPSQMAFEFNQSAHQQASPMPQAAPEQPPVSQPAPSRTWHTYSYPPAEPQQPEAALNWEPDAGQFALPIQPEPIPAGPAAPAEPQHGYGSEPDPLKSYAQRPAAPPPGKSGSNATAAAALWPSLDATETGLPVTDQPISPVKKTAWGLWIMVSLLAIFACGVAAMLSWEQIQRRIQRLGSQPPPASPAAASPAEFSALAAKPAGMSGLDQRIAVGAAMDDAEALARKLFNSETLEEKLACIASPAAHRPEVAGMFDGSSDEPAFVSFAAISNPPLDLATGRLLPMFRVITSRNRSGALILMVNDAATAKPVILWPLFHETHEGALTRHLLDKDSEPRWFHVGLRLAHSFDLPAASREAFLSLDIDGSTDGSGRITAFATKDSPIGRKLDRQTEWGRFYFGRVLAAWMDIAGRKRLTIIDCTGSAEEPVAEGGQAAP